MELLLWCLGGISILGILHSYLIYPIWVMSKASGLSRDQAYFCWSDEVAEIEKARPWPPNNGQAAERENPLAKKNGNEGFARNVTPRYFGSQKEIHWPRVSVLMAVHNEEKVLADKLDGLLAQDYLGDYVIYVGSDNSTDRTNDILKAYASRHPQLHIVIFTSRQGKPGIINQLQQQVKTPEQNHFYLLTDASVMLAPDVVTQLILPSLTRPDLTVMDARMIHTGIRQSGISKTEDHYISREVSLKQAQGKLNGFMIGPFGGCFALRSDVFTPVPDNFLVDDFFLCLAAYEKGGRGISVPNAHCYEGVGQNLSDEFRRKVRISSGNWQNAVRFFRFWWPPTGQLAFAFFSHKILRWLTPFLLVTALAALAALSFGWGNYWAGLMFYFLIGLLTVPAVLDALLSKFLGINWQPLRAIRYFLAMNLALLVGFFRFLNGIQSNVWQPSERH